MELPPQFRKYQEEIEQELRDILAQRKAPLYRMMRYQLGWIDEKGEAVQDGQGKRLRPLLALLSCKAAGGDHRLALPAGAAVELVHNFSLVHDDIQDGSPERRHRPTVWWLWGPAQAINAGDGLHALGRLALFRLADRGLPLETVLEAVRVLDEACLALCEGQYMDMSYQERVDITLEAYFKMVEGKAGALMACGMELGALVAGAGEEVRRAFARAGLNLGIAFQVRDDILDLWGADGGAQSSDVLNKKKSLPIVYALDKATIRQKRELGTIFFKRVLEPPDVEQVTAILGDLKAREYAEETAQRYYQQAMEALASVPCEASALEEVRTLGRFMVQRDR